MFEPTHMLRRTIAAGAIIAATSGLCAVGLPAVASALPTGSGDAGSSGSAGGSADLAMPLSSPAGLIALTAAVSQTGKPYLWGGTGPNSWDCSGLVQWAFRQAGVELPRTSQQMAKVGERVPLWALSPGDVVVLNSDASHVGIYLGFGQVFNAYGRGVPVGIAPLAQWQIYSIRRF